MRNQSVKVKKQIVSILILLLLIGVTFFFYLKDYSFHELWLIMKDARIVYLFAGLGMMLLFIFCEAVNIYFILKALGYKIPLIRCYAYSNIGFYFSSITPTASGGQPAQIYYMMQGNIPLAISSITLFFIVYVYQIAMILLGIIMSMLRISAATYFVHKLNYLLLFGVLVNITVIFVMFSLMFSKKLVPSILGVVLKLGAKIGIVKNIDLVRSKWKQSLISYHEKAEVLKSHPKLFFKILAVTMIQMISLNSVSSLVYYSMGYGSKQILNIFTCQSLLTISVSPVPLPGAEGITQGGFLQVFGTFFPQDVLTYAMLINRFISFYIPLLLSLFLYIITHLRSINQAVRGDSIDR